MEQEATLRIPIANVPMPQPLPPAHLVIQPQQQPLAQQTTQSLYLPDAQPVAHPPTQMAPYASAPPPIPRTWSLAQHLYWSPRAPAQCPAPECNMCNPSAPPSARHIVVAPDMSHRTPSEQVVIQALQAVSNYPEFRDIVETVSRQMPGLQNLLGATGQPEG